MVIAMTAKRLLVLQKSMGKLLSVLASAKIFLLSLWTQSLVLNHNQEKKILFCDAVFPNETICSFANGLSVASQ